LKLIVGLGNPGRKYYFTRHNIGFRVIDVLAREWDIPITKKKMLARWGKGNWKYQGIILAKPQTYMNLSGESVIKLVKYFRIKTEDIIVIHDDIDLKFGNIKVRENGGDGGHKGIKSLIEQLGDRKFIRIRAGVDRPDKYDDVSNYVLEIFDHQQKKTLKAYIKKAAEAVETIVLEGTVAAMNRYNTK